MSVGMCVDIGVDRKRDIGIDACMDLCRRLSASVAGSLTVPHHAITSKFLSASRYRAPRDAGVWSSLASQLHTRNSRRHSGRLASLRLSWAYSGRWALTMQLGALTLPGDHTAPSFHAFSFCTNIRRWSGCASRLKTVEQDIQLAKSAR